MAQRYISTRIYEADPERADPEMSSSYAFSFGYDPAVDQVSSSKTHLGF